MITYKDRSFCSHSGICCNTKCDRNLDLEAAKESGLPIAFSDFRTDSCGFKIDPNLLRSNLELDLDPSYG